MMIEETKWIKQLLPNHYTCEPRENGVHCYSYEGIPDDQGPCDHFSWHFENDGHGGFVRVCDDCGQWIYSTTNI